MKNKLAALTMGACLFTTIPVFAAESLEQTQARLESALLKVNSQTELLQKEIKQLKAELAAVKKEKQSSKAVVPSTPESPQKPSRSFVPQINAMVPAVTGPLPAGSADLDPSAFLSFQNGMSQGRFFLEQQKAFESKLNGASPSYASQPQLTFSGKLETTGAWQRASGSNSNSSINLNTAELIAFMQASEWASGFIAIEYNNSSLDPLLNGSGNPANNSNFFLNRGFLTIGNLNKSPIYFSTGLMYAPFGAYSTNILSNPVTKVMGRTNTRAAQLGFEKDGFNTSLYVFDGASIDVGHSKIDNWGADAEYNWKMADFSAGVGGGYINNISDAQGAQATGGGAGTFAGFSRNVVTEALVHYVPGVNVHLSLGRGPLYFVAEGIAAVRSYSPLDMTFNSAGARPKSGHLEAGYNFNLLGKKSIFSVAYEQTWQALAMGLPRNSYIAAFNTSIWKNTVETLEFRHDVNYGAGNVSGGACSFTDSGGNVFRAVCPGPSGGGSSNTVLAQIGVYF